MLKKSLLAGLAAGLALATGALWPRIRSRSSTSARTPATPISTRITGGFEDACKQLGCEFEFVAPATAEATSQIPFIEAQIQRGVNVIAIAPNSPDALNQVLDDARPKGILVLTVNGDLTGNESHRDATILPVDFTRSARPGRAGRLADRLRGRDRHPLGHHRGARPEHLDRGHERDAQERSEIRQDEAGRDRLWRRPAGEVDHRNGSAAFQLPEPQGRDRADHRGYRGGRAGRAVARHCRQGRT